MLGNNLGLMQTAASSGATYTYATWNSGDKSGAITLSGGDLSASQTASAALVRATLGKSSGKWYWEVRPTTAANVIGVANASASLTQWCGQNANSWGYYATDGRIYTNNSPGSTNAAYASGDVIGLALDMDAGTLTFYKNGVAQPYGVSGLTGTIYPAWGDNSADACTANFGTSMLKFQPPAGYNAGVFTSSGLPTFATWNPSDKGAGMTLSNGNLTAAVGTVSMVRSTQSMSSGKWYWEVTRVSGADFVTGVAKSGASLTTALGGDANGWGYIGSNGNKYNSASSVAYGATIANGDVVGVALDLDGGTLTFYKNGVSQGVAYSGLSGTFYAAFGSGNGGETCTANFGATPFTYAPPAGYSHGVASTAYTPTINYATWDANDKGGYITLSNGNLSASATGVGASVRANRSVSAGKWYWEETADTANCAAGVEKFGANLGAYPGYDANGWSYSANGNKYNTNSGAAFGATYTTGDVVGVAYDSKAGSLMFYKNGGLIGTAWVSGVTAPVFPSTGNSSATAIGTANFGATALKYAPPAGYSWGVGDRPTPFSRSYATWNPADKGASFALSSGNLVNTTSNVAGQVRGTIGKSSGKWYWEFVLSGSITGNVTGVSKTTSSVNTATGNDTSSWGYNNNGLLYTNSSGSAYGSSSVAGDVIGVALDMNAGTLVFYKNGVSMGVAATGLSGTLYPSSGMRNGGSGVVVTANFGATPFAYPAPTGFTGLY